MADNVPEDPRIPRLLDAYLSVSRDYADDYRAIRQFLVLYDTMHEIECAQHHQILTLQAALKKAIKEMELYRSRWLSEGGKP
jgi:hypothetical protein